MDAASKRKWKLGQRIENLAELDEFAAVPFPHGHPSDIRTFYSPVDNVHDALCRMVASATSSLIIAMFGFADTELAEIIQDHIASTRVYVSLTLDSTQAGGRGEREILKHNDYPTNSLAVGRSEKGAIMHLKMVLIDGTDVVTGSTNWSEGGETKQDNELTIRRSPLEAIRARQRIDVIHNAMLQAMIARDLEPRKRTEGFSSGQKT